MVTQAGGNSLSGEVRDMLGEADRQRKGSAGACLPLDAPSARETGFSFFREFSQSEGRDFERNETPTQSSTCAYMGYVCQEMGHN